MKKKKVSEPVIPEYYENEVYDPSFNYVETKQIKRTIVEEFVDIDESLKELEKNNELIRMEMNIIEFPIFSKNRALKVDQIRKYYFSTDKKKFIEIIPAESETIPGEFEEKVFIGLLEILKNSGYKQTFYCSASDILDSINIKNKTTRKSLFPKVKKALMKLAETNYRFNNVFYSNHNSGVVNDLISTTILSYRYVSFKDADFSEKEYFLDGRTKEIYKINLSSEIYDNLIKKGYLVFDADELLNIKDSVTRSIYTQITKWRNNKLYLKRPALYIARRIPLSWNNKVSISNSVKKIIKSLNELKSLGFITDFKEIKGKKIELTEFEVIFGDEHNKNRQELLYQDKEDYSNFIHSVEDRINDKPFQKDVSDHCFKIVSIFGPKGATLKTLPNVVKEALSKYEFEFVRDTAEYTAYNAKASLLKYFKEALVNNWADEYISKKKAKENKIAAKKMEVIEEAHIVESTDSKVLNLSWEDFEKLPIESQNKIKDKAYKIYLEETNSSDTKSSRGIFEKTQKALIVKIYNQDIEEPSVIAEPEEKADSKKVYPNLANFSMNFYKLVKKANLDITLEDIISSLKLLGEYDDGVFYAVYDLESNTGYYELKK